MWGLWGEILQAAMKHETQDLDTERQKGLGKYSINLAKFTISLGEFCLIIFDTLI
jgi:hypothetical protein